MNLVLVGVEKNIKNAVENNEMDKKKGVCFIKPVVPQ